MKLRLVRQRKLQAIGAGVYCLLNNVLFRDGRNGWLTLSCIPLALLGLKSIRDYLQVTHSPDGCSKCVPINRAFKTFLGVPFMGVKTYA
jgi:hypothetical protein